MFSLHRQPCSNNCQPSWPCGAIWCLNWRPPPNYRPYYWGTTSWRGPNPSPWGDHHKEDAFWSSNNVRMGVGYTSSRDLDMTIYTDGVIRGRKSVHLASGNYAWRDLWAEVYGNVVDSTRDLSIGVANASGHDSGHDESIMWISELATDLLGLSRSLLLAIGGGRLHSLPEDSQMGRLKDLGTIPKD